MSADFGQKKGETDIDQLVRVVEELEKAFKKLSNTTETLSKRTYVDFMKITASFMKLEKKRLMDTEKHHQLLQKLNVEYRSKAKLDKSRYLLDKDLLTIKNREKQEARSHKLELEREHDQSVRQHILMRGQMKNSSDKLNFFSKALLQGIGTGAVIGQVQSGLLGVYSTQKRIKDLELTIADQKVRAIKASAESRPNVKLIEAIEQSIIRNEEDLKEQTAQLKNSLTGKMLGDKGMSNLNKMGEFASKHAGGLILGAGAAGVLLTVLKKAIDVSPVFQSMLKMLDYGVMLILRPIGDFFGFIFRPIMILMLRKFIIPFYQNLYPKLMKLGTEIGEGIVGLLSSKTFGEFIMKLLGIDETKTAFENLKSSLTSIATLIGVGLGGAGTLLLSIRLLKGGLNGIVKALELLGIIPKTDTTTTTDTSVKGTNGTGGTNKTGGGVNKSPTGGFVASGSKTTSGGVFMGQGTTTQQPNTIKQGNYSKNPVIKEFQKFVERITETMKRKGFNGKWFGDQISSYMSKNDTLKNLINAGSRYGAKVMDFAGKVGRFGTRLVRGGWSLLEPLMLDMFPNLKQVSGNAPASVTMANGGMITEPISGVGQRTGKSYLMGERGNEMVVPMGGKSGMGGIVVNINISNMSGSREDINKIKDVVLRVMQESSSKMVR